jgi:hypothetical protein
MQIICCHCQRTLEYSGEAPRFCAYCGQSISTQGPEAPTLAYDAVPSTATADIEPGADGGPAPEKVGGYKLVRTLGGGGMGTVYEAEDTTTGRRIALKLIAPQFAASRDAVERFRLEGRLASSIAHPRCVFVVAADEEGGRPYIVMELMPGDTLDDLVRRDGPMQPRQAIAKILDVIEGLNEAHRLGVIHRDVKPSNCFLEHDGRVKIGDFGLSKSLASDQQLTKTGSFLGTVLFSSPEQVRRESLDHQTDVYSVAATLYYLLTGRAPYQTGDAMATIAQILSDPPTPLRTHRPDLPPTLERVVLKGLERNRDRRYRNLSEFREALLPFYHRQFSIGSVGWRLLAYLIDVGLIYIVQQVLVIVILLSMGYDVAETGFDQEQAFQMNSDPKIRVLAAIPAVLWLLYFILLEGLWGATLGKLILRLRVLESASDSPAGWGRLALRSLICLLLTHLGDMGVWVLLVLDVFDIQNVNSADLEQASTAMFALALLGLVAYAGWGTGIALLVSTMRNRNGHRGLHEILSGTRVIRLAERRTFSILPSSKRSLVAPPVFNPAELPAEIGSFLIHGALRWDEEARILLGEDESLRRKVWVVLRSMDQQGPSPVRQSLSRTSRMRWLAAGQHEGQHWDAFVAPSGGRLGDAVAAEGPLTWPEIRPLLEQLGSELMLAVEEWTLPDTLTVDQVWLQSQDRVVLLDLPLTRPFTPACTEVEVVPTPQDRCLALLRETALLALEGTPRSPETTDPHVNAPIPGYAAALLGRLRDADNRFQGPKEFREEIAALRDQPDEVNRRRRFGQLAILAAFCSLWLFCCIPASTFYMSPGFLPLFGTEAIQLGLRMTKEEFDKESRRDLSVTLVDPNPWSQLAGVARYEQDQRLLQRLEESAQSLESEKHSIADKVSPTQRWILGAWQQVMSQQRDTMRQSFINTRRNQRGAVSFRPDAEQLAKQPIEDMEPLGMTFTYIVLGTFCVFPVLFILWAFIIRGGLSFRLAGIALVRRDGRPAGRFQCLWRAVLVWAPIAILMALSLLVEGIYWSGWSDLAWRTDMNWLRYVAYGLWYTGLALIVLFAALAIVFPRRSLHDFLSGVYLVPR